MSKPKRRGEASYRWIGIPLVIIILIVLLIAITKLVANIFGGR